MSKTKSTTENVTSTTAEIFAGAELLKSGFEKTAKIFETAAELGKGNTEACVASASIANNGFRTISTEISMYSKKAVEESVAATRALMGAKSIHEAIELQTDFARMAFSAYVGQLKILNGLFMGTAKDSMAPVQARFKAFKDIAQIAQIAPTA